MIVVRPTWPPSSSPVPQLLGIYHAVVVNNQDPNRGNRVKLKIPQVLGTAVSDWAPNVNSTSIPSVGTAVYAMFTGGDRTKPVYFLVENGPALSSTVVQLFGAVNSFGPVTNLTQTASGHSFVATPVPGWLFGKGEAPFYTEVMSDGQVVMSTLPFTENELEPTSDHAEINVFDPGRFKFYSLIIPTSTNVTTTLASGRTTGGTDVGAGDLRRILNGNQERLIFTCGGLYFNWDIAVDGLYPVIGFLERSLMGDWTYAQADSLTSNQWESTDPSLYQSVIAGGHGQSTGVNGSYWPTGTVGQMAVLPQSGNIVVGHYFGPAVTNAGVISVISPTGTLLASYQIPNITPVSGTITTAAVRDVESDPSSILNDERFVVMYDGFGTGIEQHPFQEFSYNASTQTITPKSVPCMPADYQSHGAFTFIDSQGTLYVTCFGGASGLSTKNMQVYQKHSGERNIVTQAPANPGWQTGTWPTTVKSDYTLNSISSQGLGFLAGPMTQDPVTGAIVVPGNSGKLGAYVPSYPLSLGPNLLSAADSGFETVNLLSSDDATFAASLGTWSAFLGSMSRTTTPPVAPPSGTNAAQTSEAFGSLIVNTGHYTVLPNTPYQAQIYFLAGTVGRTCEVYFQWYDGSGNVISTSVHSTIVDNTATWVANNQQDTSPGNAASVQIFAVVDSSGAGELHYIASNSLWNMSLGPDWTQFLTTISKTAEAAHTGTFSMKLQAPFSGEVLTAFGPKINVVPGQEYFASAWFLAGVGSPSQPCDIHIRFFDVNNFLLNEAVTAVRATDNTSTWVQSTVGGWAPPNSVTAEVLLQPTTTNAGEVHYADDVFFGTQPFTSVSAVDLNIVPLRNAGYNISLGRGCINNRRYYNCVANTFTTSEQSAYNALTYVPAYKPQYLISVDLAKILSH